MRINDAYYQTQTMDNSPFARVSANHESLNRIESLITSETPKNKERKSQARLNRDVAHLYQVHVKGQTTPSELQEQLAASRNRGINKVAVVQRQIKEPSQPSTFKAAVQRIQTTSPDYNENLNT